MRFKSLALASVLAVCPWVAYAQPITPPSGLQVGTTALTLDEAWRLADAANPALKTKQAQLAAAEGSRADAAAPLYNNPQISLENTRRSVPQEMDRRYQASRTAMVELMQQVSLNADAGAEPPAAPEGQLL